MQGKNKILQLPISTFQREGQSQCDRIVMEVMQKLFSLLPNNAEQTADFYLADGTKCWIKKFSEPSERDGEPSYGFDVKFEDGQPLSHIEFLVKCSGWERGLINPVPNQE